MKKAKQKKRKTIPVHSSSKPFCDCRQCKCETCPDIRDILPVSLDFNKNIRKFKDADINTSSQDIVDENYENLDSNTLKKIKNKQVCNCDVVATAVRSNVRLDLSGQIRHAEDK